MRATTHRLGMKCIACHEELVDDLCKCGSRHGHSFQDPGPWAAEHWPEHPCFQCACPPHACSVDCRICLRLGPDDACPNEVA